MSRVSDGAQYPFWSPDSEWVAFIADVESRGLTATEQRTAGSQARLRKLGVTNIVSSMRSRLPFFVKFFTYSQT